MIGGFYAFDIIVLAIVLVSAILAFARGFFRETLAVLSWIAAFFVALYGFKSLQPTMRDIINIPQVADIVTAVSLFVVSLIIFSLIATLLTSRVKDGKLGPVDRSLGFVFGIVRGFFVVSLLYLLAFFILKDPLKFPDWVQKAKLTGFVDYGARTIYRWIPDAWLDDLSALVKDKTGTSVDPFGIRSKKEADSNEEIFFKLNQPTTEDKTPTEDKLENQNQNGYSPDQQRNLQNTIDQVDGEDSEQITGDR